MEFFEQIGKKISDAGTSISNKTKDYVEVNRINGEIKELEKRINSLFTEIGKSYFERHHAEENAEEYERINQIKASIDEIAIKKDAIRKIKGLVLCENCGAELSDDSRFCNICGAEVTQHWNAADPVNSSECPHCHAVLKEGALFCVNCGAKVENNNTAQPMNSNECPHCHAALKEGALFCVNCGAKVENN